MSNREQISDYKTKLARMGESLDRRDHPLNYYKQLYLEKSNAKNKVTRDNTSFYTEQIINKKRQRSSGKKKNKKNLLDFNDIIEEEDLDEFDKMHNIKGIKTTRLIESKKKKKPQKNEEIKEAEIIQEKKVIRNNAKLNKEKKEILSNNYNLRKKPMKEYDEKNIIKFGAQNDINIKKNNNITDKNIINQNSPQNDSYLYVNENLFENQEKPKIIPQKKVLLKRQNDVITEENEPKKEQYSSVEDNNIIKYNDENNANHMEMDNENDNNLKKNDNNFIEEEREQIPIETETSSFVSNTTSRFSRFTNFSFMSLSRLGSNIVCLKNSIMNKFRRNAYLFPLVILILFGIIFFFNEKYENFERNNIIIIFSIIMGLIILFNLVKCLKSMHNYKKMAKNDKKILLEKYDINTENLGEFVLNDFIIERIRENGIDEETYIKYVFPYLAKYLEKDGFFLEKRKK